MTQSTLMTQVVAFLKQEYYLLEVALIILATVLIYYLYRFKLKRIFEKKTSNESFLSCVILPAADKPVAFYMLFLGFSYALERLIHAHNIPVIASYLPIFRKAFVVFFMYWFISIVIKSYKQFYIDYAKNHEKQVDETLINALAQLSYIVSAIIAVMITLQILGIPISGLIAFGGIGGAGIAFASKDLLANFFGSLVIYMDKPFKVGDWVKSPDKDIEGTVIHIGMRATTIQTFQRRFIYVPNGLFLVITVENASRMTHRRLDATIGIRYDDAKKIEQVIEDIRVVIDEHPRVDHSLSNRVFFTEFGSSSLNISLTVYVNETSLIAFSGVRQEIFMAILDIIEKHGAECAFPTQTLHVPSPISIKS